MEAGKKIAFRLNTRQLSEIEKLKQKEYFNKPYSDLYRDLIDRGLNYSKQIKKGDK